MAAPALALVVAVQPEGDEAPVAQAASEPVQVAQEQAVDEVAAVPLVAPAAQGLAGKAYMAKCAQQPESG